MKTRRILFVVTNLGCGGINRALENLLNVWGGQAQVDVLAFDSTGQYHDGFEYASMLKTPLFIDCQTRRFKEQTGLDKLACAAVKILNRCTGYCFYGNVIRRLERKIADARYDAVIAFSEGLPTSFVANVKNHNKIAWIHCDYKSYLSFCPDNLERERKIYSKFNHIVCVSDYTRSSFVDVFPEFESRTEYIYNVLDTEGMKKDAAEFEVKEYDKSNFNIVTVGRIDPVKCPSRIPMIASNLKTKNFNWYIVGPIIWQSEYEKLVCEIKKYGLSDRIHLLGEKSNPYPYIMNADVLVNTSVSEACPYVINEAKILGTPVVCCDFGSAKEFIANGENGFSVPVAKVADYINKLHDDHSLYATVKENLLHFDYDNEAIITKFTKLL